MKPSHWRKKTTWPVFGPSHSRQHEPTPVAHAERYPPRPGGGGKSSAKPIQSHSFR